MRNPIIGLSAILIVVNISSCSDSELKEKPREKILLFYKNGNKFCEGEHWVYTLGSKERKFRTGIWRFYFSNGNIESIHEYDSEGELINFKKYGENGKLKESDNYSETAENLSEFYENGNLKNETITTIEIEKDENTDDEYKTYYSAFKEYYENGQLKSYKIYINDVLEGYARIWDSDGNLIIKYEYENGLIIP